jgi:hypothetical protein
VETGYVGYSYCFHDSPSSPSFHESQIYPYGLVKLSVFVVAMLMRGVTSDAKDIFSLVGGGSAWRHCWGMSRGTCMYPDEVNATKRFIPPPSRGIIAKFHHIHAREPIS